MVKFLSVMKQNCTYFYSILPLRFLTITSVVLCIFLLNGCDVIKNQLAGEAGRYETEGNQLLVQGRFNEAILAFRHALTIDPSLSHSSFSLAQLYRDQGRTRLGKWIAQAALVYDAQNSDLKNLLEKYPGNPPDSNSFKQLWIYAPYSMVKADINSLPDPVGFTLTNGNLILTYRDGLIIRVNTETGIPAWQINVKEEISSAPVSNGKYFVLGAKNGRILFLDEKDGSLIWSYQTGGAVFGACNFSASSVICGSDDQNMYALRISDGSVLWKFKTEGYLHAQPVVFGKSVVFGSGDTRLYNLDVDTGASLWNSAPGTQGGIESRPLVKDGVIYAGSNDSRVYALAENSGAEIWQYSTPDAIFSTPLVQGDVVYIASTGQMISAVNRESGDEIWSNNTAASINFDINLYKEVILYQEAADPYVYVIDKNSGEEKMKIDTGDWIGASPILAGGRLYVLGKDGAVNAYKLGF